MSKALRWPRGWQIPGPRGSTKFTNAHPRTDKADKCPVVARGVGWAQLELNDALYSYLRLAEGLLH